MSFYQIQQLFIKELRSKLPQLVIGSFVVYFLASLVVTTTLNTLSNRKIEASVAFQNAQANIASTTQNIIRTFSTQPKQAVLPATTTVQQVAPVVENTYIVQEGDSLWTIAEAKLGSGFKYTELIKSNAIVNPSLLAIGEKIVISAKTEVNGHILPEAAFTNIPSVSDSTAVSQQVYSVQEGDSLWTIAEAKLGSGELWTRIADINELKNPRDIDPGDTLNLPQKN